MLGILLGGTGLRGICDRVPGQFHVGTSFMSIEGIPTFPMETVIVLEGDMIQVIGAKMIRGRWSTKSVRLAYLRWWSPFATILALLFGIVFSNDVWLLESPKAELLLIAWYLPAVLCAALFVCSMFAGRRASPERVKEILAELFPAPAASRAPVDPPPLPVQVERDWRQSGDRPRADD